MTAGIWSGKLMTDFEGRPQFDYDQHSADYAQHGLAIESDLRSQCPVAWSPNHGGFWALSTHSAVTGVLRDRDLCSSAKSTDADGNVVGGMSIPPTGGYRFIPGETDPPEWDGHRKVLNRAFAPSAVSALEPMITAFTTEIINRVIDTGRADYIIDIANPVTALITMDILGLPRSDWEFYAGPIHRHPYEPYSTETNAAIAAIQVRLMETVVARRGSSGQGGLLEELLTARIDGELLSDRELVDTLWQLLTGGFGTTASLLGGAWSYLEDHPDDRHHVSEADERALRIATEEFVRWVCPVMNEGRTAKQDIAVGGQTIRAGDRVWVMYRSANRDSTLFDRPDEVDLARYPNRHLGFGAGIHRCLGSNLARLVFQVVLRASLLRFTDYRVQRDVTVQLPRMAKLNGWMRMPFTFAPGPRLESGLAADFDR
jgi:cytochrome P450